MKWCANFQLQILYQTSKSAKVSGKKRRSLSSHILAFSGRIFLHSGGNLYVSRRKKVRRTRKCTGNKMSLSPRKVVQMRRLV